MKPLPRSIRRSLVVAGAVLTLALGYSAATNAMVFGAPPEEAPAEPTPVAQADDAPVELDETRLLAGLAVWKDGGCRGCHGWAANGEREGPQPEGPSLRDSLLSEDLIRLTVACGRPGTPMPYFWRDAYRRDSTECYGQTGAEFGDLLPNQGGARFNDGQLDDLAYYLAYYVQGLGEITFEECEFYWGEGNTRCDFYR